MQPSAWRKVTDATKNKTDKFTDPTYKLFESLTDGIDLTIQIQYISLDILTRLGQISIS